MLDTVKQAIPHETAQTHAPLLPEKFFGRLEQEEVRYLVYKNIATVGEALAGRCDLDVLAARADLEQLRSILRDGGGFPARSHWLYDNSIPEREDWFLPIGGAQLMHLDIAHAVMAGPKFNKRYALFEYEDLAVRRLEAGGLQIPVAQPIDRLRIGFVKLAFALPSRITGNAWVEAEGGLAAELSAGFPAVNGVQTVLIRLGGVETPVRIRKESAAYLVEYESLARVRRSVRGPVLTGPLAVLREKAIHHLSRAGYALRRRAGRFLPLPPADKRHFPTGRIVALIGPDGLGKSTQAARLVAAFGEKFRCTSLYLGSNDGSWMRFRHMLRPNPRKGKARGDNGQRTTQKGLARGRWYSTGSAIWRLIMGMRRYLAVRRAVRLAGNGALVITDRWPQNLADGMLDGPSRAPSGKFRLASAIWRLEKRIYRSMSRHAPTLAIHFDAPYAVSASRKPGDIERDDFEARVALMRRMREGDAAATVVDAAQAMDTVTAQLFDRICRHLGGA